MANMAASSSSSSASSSSSSSQDAGPSTSYYHRAHLALFGSIRRGQPELAARFFEYYGLVFAHGELDRRVKSLAALAVAHAVQCPYCIDAYTKGSLEKGADLEQLSEAVHVAAAVRASSVAAYAAQMFAEVSELEMGATAGRRASEAYFARQHVGDRDPLSEAAPELRDAASQYEARVLADGALPSPEKAIIGLSVAHAIQCPYSIDVYTKACIERGQTLSGMTEAVHVAAAIRGGASLVHGLQMLEHYDELSQGDVRSEP